MVKSIGPRPRPVYVCPYSGAAWSLGFGPDGRCLSQSEQEARGDAQGYVDQVAYAGQIIRDVVTTLQAPGRERPVILIQADEGPYPDREEGVAWQHASIEQLRIKTGILNAFYFPNGNYGLLYPDVSPVNSYRVLFDTYFMATLPPLSDRIIAFPFANDLYNFHDVTAVVRGATAVRVPPSPLRGSHAGTRALSPGPGPSALP